MWRLLIRSVGLLAALAALALEACVGQANSVPPAGATGTPIDAATVRPSTATAPSPEGTAPAVITEADTGRTFVLATGSTVALRLSNGWRWVQPSADSDAVRFTPVAYLVDPGFSEWTLEAVHPGVAQVTSKGQPNCADPAQCPARQFDLSVTVP